MDARKGANWSADRREAVVAATLVGAVVVILGYASGLGVTTRSDDLALGPPGSGTKAPTVPSPAASASPDAPPPNDPNGPDTPPVADGGAPPPSTDMPTMPPPPDPGQSSTAPAPTPTNCS